MNILIFIIIIVIIIINIKMVIEMVVSFATLGSNLDSESKLCSDESQSGL